jgi:hypothetical protein
MPEWNYNQVGVTYNEPVFKYNFGGIINQIVDYVIKMRRRRR